VLLGLVWLAIGAQLTALTAGRYGPYSDARAGGPRAPFGALFSRRTTAREPEALEGPS
jgi:hypothetical protein